MWLIKKKKKRFEQTVEECIMPVSSFIHDSFYALSNKSFDSIDKVMQGEKQLVEGIHRLYVFASTNHYNRLKEAATIRLSDDNEVNTKSFSYCLLILEEKYVDYRKKRALGNFSESERQIVEQMNIFFRDYLDILSKYMFTLMHKHCGRIELYYEELSKLNKEIEDYECESQR